METEKCPEKDSDSAQSTSLAKNNDIIGLNQ